MNRVVGFLSLLCVVIFPMSLSASGQSVSDYAVQVTAAIQTNPPSITLSWPGDTNALDFYVYRKLRDDVSWGPGVALPPSATGFVDTDVVVGGAYEYSIFKDTLTYVAEGYVYAGLLAPMNESRGKVILLVDESHAPALTLELARLQQDLAGDGWTVLRHDVARNASVTDIKGTISTDYQADPAEVKAVFLLGHVPVPYSGNLNPDGRADHKGAWPADVYYGITNGIWTDSSVNTTTASDPRNWNVPGDGNFDQTELTSVVKLQVGRVDFANLPAFPQGERELLRQYLNKDHRFRQGRLAVQRRGLIDDNLGVAGQQAYAVNGWRNFAPFFGTGNIVVGDWLSTPAGQSFLWAYGCGSGAWTSAAGVANTWNLVTNDTPFVFTMLYGDYFGDWDSQNNLMRAQLATATYTLACSWAGRPYWYFHHMGLGETIGFSARLTQNWSAGSIPGTLETHVALMGDPTLRMHPVAPASALRAAANGSGGVDLSWGPSPDVVAGYHVYRAPTAAGPFTRLTADLLAGNSYTDATGGTDVYMVRAVKLEQTPSGSYYNPSQGIFQSADGTAGAPWVELFEPTNNANYGLLPSIRLSASLLDPASSVTNVAFFANGGQIGASKGPSYAFTWNNVAGGVYSITARAYCSTGFQTNSAPVTVTVASAAAPRLTLNTAVDGSKIILGDDTLGRVHRIQYVTDPGLTNWQTLGTATGGPSGTFEFIDSTVASQRFYRSVEP